jgi:hypothetical protein
MRDNICSSFKTALAFRIYHRTHSDIAFSNASMAFGSVPCPRAALNSDCTAQLIEFYESWLVPRASESRSRDNTTPSARLLAPLRHSVPHKDRLTRAPPGQ